MRVLGIDPGLQITGYGVIDCCDGQFTQVPTLVDAGVIRLDTKASLPARLHELWRELDQLLDEHRPDVCAVEQLYAHYAHPRTAILMGHARGVILLAAQCHGVTIKQYAATRIKQAVSGHGHARKAQMQRAIQGLWNLPTPPSPPDVADALAIAVCCSRALVTESALDRARRTRQ